MISEKKQMNMLSKQKQQKIIYSLPKTQPTLSSSSKSKYNPSIKSSYDNMNSNKSISLSIQNINNCSQNNLRNNYYQEQYPQVSEFSTQFNQFRTQDRYLKTQINQTKIQDNKQQKYTHNMRIDYGKLQKPIKYQKLCNKNQNKQNKQQLNRSIKKQIDLSNDLTLLLSTKKFKNLKQYTLNSSNKSFNELSKYITYDNKQIDNQRVNLSQKFNKLVKQNIKQNNDFVISVNQNQKQGIQPPIHSLLTKKKSFSTQKINSCINPQSGNKLNNQKLNKINYQLMNPISNEKMNMLRNDKTSNDKIRKKNRIISVKAYQTLNHTPLIIKSQINQNQQYINNQKYKGFNDTPSMKQKVIDNNSLITDRTLITDRAILSSDRTMLSSDRSDRKISHSRIIKTFNPTAGLQTKIITYPDLSQVFKLRQSRKK